MRLRHVFLVLCLLGLVLPNAVFWPWFVAHGLAPRQFVTDLFANGVSSFFGLDVILAALAVVLFIEVEGRRLALPFRWVSIAATCLVGVSLGFPLFLYQRQLQLDRGI